MDNEYCIKNCELGRKKSRELLDQSNSAYEAALDMYWFVEECKKTCPLWKEVNNDT